MTVSILTPQVRTTAATRLFSGINNRLPKCYYHVYSMTTATTISLSSSGDRKRPHLSNPVLYSAGYLRLLKLFLRPVYCVVPSFPLVQNSYPRSLGEPQLAHNVHLPATSPALYQARYLSQACTTCRHSCLPSCLGRNECWRYV